MWTRVRPFPTRQPFKPWECIECRTVLKLRSKFPMYSSMMVLGDFEISQIFPILFILFAFIQLLAFIEGARVVFELDPLLALIAFFAVGMVPLFGGLAILYISFVGAVRGWMLSWWVALMVVWPGLVWAFAAHVSLGVDVLIERFG